MNRLTLVAALLVIASTTPVLGQDPTQDTNLLPFSKEEDADGARFVWFILARAGQPYDYLAAKDIPGSPLFAELRVPWRGVMVWWPEFVGIFGGDGQLLTAAGREPLEGRIAQYGSPRYFSSRIPRVANGFRPYRFLNGALELMVPIDWHVTDAPSDGPVDVLTLHVRNPAIDTTGADRTNIVFFARFLRDRPSLQDFSDSLLGDSQMEWNATILSDQLSDSTVRLVWWRGRLRGTAYLVLDGFHAQDSLYVNFRLAYPLGEQTPAAWRQAFARDFGNLMNWYAASGTHPLRGVDTRFLMATP